MFSPNRQIRTSRRLRKPTTGDSFTEYPVQRRARSDESLGGSCDLSAVPCGGFVGAAGEVRAPSSDGLGRRARLVLVASLSGQKIASGFVAGKFRDLSRTLVMA